VAVGDPEHGRARQSVQFALSRARRLGRRVLRGRPDGEPFAANYTQWQARQGKSLIPVWLSESTRTERSSAVAVVFHVYFVDLVDEFIAQLAQIPVDFDLVVTNSSGTPLSIPIDRLPHAKTISIVDSPNHGRDIFPFVSVVNAGLLDNARLVLKVHTKKSAWRDNREDLAGSGETWKAGFLAELLGSTANVEQILSGFAEDSALGVVTSTGNVLGTEYWGGDEAITRSLFRRLGRELDAATLRFPAGSMYWVNPAVIRELKRMNLDAEDFETEAGQIDGTTAHAVERSMGLITMALGLAIEDRATMPAPYDPAAWRAFVS